MKEYIKMGFGFTLGIALCGTLVNLINDCFGKNNEEPKTEDDKVEESAE